MNSLVGYESSSDEDSPVNHGPVQPNQNEVNNTATTTTSSVGPLPHQQVRSDAPTNGLTAAHVEEHDASAPMVGPSRPPTDANFASGILDHIDDDNLSERDKIRLLTQTMTPMFEIPPSPPGSPLLGAEAQIKKFLELRSKGIHFNDDLASKPGFKNPSLLQNMLERAGLHNADQYATTLPLSIWNPEGFPPYSYKEELLKSQQAIAEEEASRKKALSAAGRRTIEFTPASGASPSSRTSTPASFKHHRE